MKHYLIIFGLLVTSFQLFSQNTYRIGNLPTLNIRMSLNDYYRINFQTQSRLSMMTGDFGGISNSDFEFLLSDYSLIASRRIGVSSSLAGGYLIRFRVNEINHRFIQQLTMVNSLPAFRIAHRISTDQTFHQTDPMEFRLRYRLTADIPLSGHSVDPGEFYLKISNEFLNKFQGGSYELEMRFVPLLGYAFTDDNKFEWGMDYRVNSLVHQYQRSKFWFAVKWFIEI